MQNFGDNFIIFLSFLRMDESLIYVSSFAKNGFIKLVITNLFHVHCQSLWDLHYYNTSYQKWQRKQSKFDFHCPLRNIISLQKKIWTRFKLVRNWHLHLRGYLVSKETFYPKKASLIQLQHSSDSSKLCFNWLNFPMFNSLLYWTWRW